MKRKVSDPWYGCDESWLFTILMKQHFRNLKRREAVAVGSALNDSDFAT